MAHFVSFFKNALMGGSREEGNAAGAAGGGGNRLGRGDGTIPPTSLPLAAAASERRSRAAIEVDDEEEDEHVSQLKRDDGPTSPPIPPSSSQSHSVKGAGAKKAIDKQGKASSSSSPSSSLPSKSAAAEAPKVLFSTEAGSLGQGGGGGKSSSSLSPSSSSSLKGPGAGRGRLRKNLADYPGFSVNPGSWGVGVPGPSSNSVGVGTPRVHQTRAYKAAAIANATASSSKAAPKSPEVVEVLDDEEEEEGEPKGGSASVYSPSHHQRKKKATVNAGSPFRPFLGTAKKSAGRSRYGVSEDDDAEDQLFASDDNKKKGRRTEEQMSEDDQEDVDVLSRAKKSQASTDASKSESHSKRKRGASPTSLSANKRSVAENNNNVSSDDWRKDDDTSLRGQSSNLCSIFLPKNQQRERAENVQSNQAKGASQQASKPEMIVLDHDEANDRAWAGGGAGGAGSSSALGGQVATDATLMMEINSDDDSDAGGMKCRSASSLSKLRAVPRPAPPGPVIPSCLSFLLDSAEKEAAALLETAIAHPRAKGGGGGGAASSSSASGNQLSEGTGLSYTHFQFSEYQLTDIVVRLLTDAFLSDEILNRAIDVLKETVVGTHAPHILIFNTFWYLKIKDGETQRAIKEFNKEVKKREKKTSKPVEVICVPVNIGNNHWILTVVDMIHKTVQVWDPNGTTYAKSEIPKNVRDVISKVIPEAKSLGIVKPPLLPQQPDAINCGVFVILYIIHHCFREPSREQEGPTECDFPGGPEDLVAYRLSLLTLILHSQASHFPKTSPVLLSFLAEPVQRRHVARAQEDDAAGIQRKHLKPTARQQLMLSLVHDRVDKRTAMMNACVELLNHHSDGRVCFLPTAWYRAVKAGNGNDALNYMAEEFTDHPIDKVLGYCAPIFVGGTWVLVVINVNPMTPIIHLHGLEGIGEAMDTVRHQIAHIFKEIGYGDLQFRELTHVFEKVTEPQVSVAIIMMCMELCRQGNVDRQPTPPAYKDPTKTRGDRTEGEDRYWADKMGIMRWILWHDERV